MRTRLIMRLDMAARSDTLQAKLQAAPDWDLIICDEAHRMAVSRLSRVSPGLPTAGGSGTASGPRTAASSPPSSQPTRKGTAAPDHVCLGMRIHAIDIIQPAGIGISPIADMGAHQTIVPAVLAAQSSAETPKKLAGRLARKTCVVRSPREIAQPLPYSSWRRHQTPVSLRPLGARSSHWYMPQRPSSPRV
jgi:hypothetical protein